MLVKIDITQERIDTPVDGRISESCPVACAINAVLVESVYSGVGLDGCTLYNKVNDTIAMPFEALPLEVKRFICGWNKGKGEPFSFSLEIPDNFVRKDA